MFKKFPPDDSRSVLKYRDYRLDQEMSFAYKIVGICGAIAMILIFMFVYCIVKIIMVMSYYVSRKKTMEMKNNQAMSRSGSNYVVMNSENDNEIYAKDVLSPSEYAEAKDDYYKFQEGINKTLDEYSTYNQNLRNYFQKSRNMEPPDQYDQRIFNVENDDW